MRAMPQIPKSTTSLTAFSFWSSPPRACFHLPGSMAPPSSAACLHHDPDPLPQRVAEKGAGPLPLYGVGENSRHLSQYYAVSFACSPAAASRLWT